MIQLRIHRKAFLVLFLVLLPVVSANGKRPANSKQATGEYTIDNVEFFGVNRLGMFVTNHGNFGRDLSGVFGYDYGTWFPFTDTTAIRTNQNNAGLHTPMYAAGIWIGGKVAGQIRVATAEYSDEYVPGPMLNGTFQVDRPEFKVYHLYSDSLETTPNADYLNWPVDQGAPLDSQGKPKMTGSQMMWSVFNDANPAQHTNVGQTNPLGIEIQHTVWAEHVLNSPVDNRIWLQYKLYNRGGNTIDSCFVSLWSDPDLGSAGDDLIGCDSLDGLFFCYNATNNDYLYGTTPPAVGFKMLLGPVVSSAADTAYFDGSVMPGYRNLSMSSFQNLKNGTDPDFGYQVYNCMKGLTANGDPLPNGTKFAVPGDPVAGTGDLDYAPSDRRMMGTFGPFTFNPGDSQYVLIEMAAAQGTNRLTSITQLKSYLNSGQSPQPALLKVSVTPNPVYLFSTAGHPATDVVCVNLGYDSSSSYGQNVNTCCICVNSVCDFDSVRTVPAAPGFTGQVIKMYMPTDVFLSDYIEVWDSASFPVAVWGLTEDGHPFDVTCPVSVYGYSRGDYDMNGTVDLDDLFSLIVYMFSDGPAPAQIRAADMSRDNFIDIEDLVLLVEYIY